MVRSRNVNIFTTWANAAYVLALICFLTHCGGGSTTTTDPHYASKKGGVKANSSPTVAIASTSLPNGTVATPYSTTLSATGGTAPYTWTMAYGLLPPGLTLNSSGTISGTPTNMGSYSFTARVTDSTGLKQSKTISILILGPLSITTTSLPSGTVGTAYSATLSATGGTSPYTWSVAAGSLPTGLSLSASVGTISGTPTASGSFTFTIQVTDSAGNKASQAFTVSIASPLSITTLSLPNGTVGVAYSATLSASGGTPPYTWSVTAGSLPAGLSLSSSGTVSGTPTTAGAYTFTVQVSDSGAQKASQSYTVSIASSSSLSVLTNSLSLAVIQQAYSAVLAATGGTTPYTWSVSSGALPPGLSLNSTAGQISGTPTLGGTYSLTVTVTDSSSATASNAFSLQVFEQPLDQYGGLLNAPSPAGPTALFRIEKTASSHWRLVSPSGNYMWMNAVYAINDQTDGGANYSSVVAKKYPSTAVWASQAVTRLKGWGFNAISAYYALGGHNVLPVSTYNSPANPVQMPFLRQIDLGYWCMASLGGPTYKVKNLYNGTNSTIFFVARDFPDVFDPQWTACANNFGANGGNVFTPNLTSTEPKMIGTWIGDSDYLFGFGRGPNTPGGAHPHLGWVTAITNPDQTSGPGGDLGNLYTYTDTVVHAKVQWQTDLQNKYVTIAALNSSWGSNYTTFGSAGGWPKSTTGGTGLMDEDGSSPWMGNGSSGLTGANANAAADMDAFLTHIADQYFSVAKSACKTPYPNHLVFGPGVLNAQTYSQVLQKAGQYLDVVEVWVDPLYVSNLNNAYNIGGKPLLVYTILEAPPDSEANATNLGTPSSTCDITGNNTSFNYTTQALRGQCYQQLLDRYRNTQGSDLTFPVIGLDWWEWVDKVIGGENNNFGLVSQYDNTYNGLEDQTTSGADSWGYTTGSEPHNHGNFSDGATQQNLTIFRAIVSGP